MTESELHKHESGAKPFEDPTDMLDSCDCGAIRFKGSAIWFVSEEEQASNTEREIELDDGQADE